MVSGVSTGTRGLVGSVAVTDVSLAEAGVTTVVEAWNRIQ